MKSEVNAHAYGDDCLFRVLPEEEAASRYLMKRERTIREAPAVYYIPHATIQFRDNASPAELPSDQAVTKSSYSVGAPYANLPKGGYPEVFSSLRGAGERIEVAREDLNE